MYTHVYIDISIYVYIHICICPCAEGSQEFSIRLGTWWVFDWGALKSTERSSRRLLRVRGSPTLSRG